MKNILSLGAGVQSSTVLLMSCVGELPKLDACVFADTGWEPKAVYAQLEWLIDFAGKHDIPIDVVSTSNIKNDALVSQVRGKAEDGNRWAAMPYFVLGPNGEKGMIRRQCTYEYKIRPIEKWTRRKILGLKHRQRAPKELTVRQWFGISHDEFTRMRTSNHKWCEHYYPLVDMGMTRQGCLNWLEQHDFPRAPRSACIGCPFHNNEEWRYLKNESPEEFQEAADFDRAVRKCGGMRGDIYLHAARKPLDEIDFRTDVDKGQKLLFESGLTEECQGMCGM
jgi:3'-phosphoadenosine 5'-phosphosulfate sulfotransferase (PAPS reductase)/FAD synthetase|tara:strand:- start:735 stop:1571 length:837 start_codon:yes stop_codon:yes gene_type:complete